MAARGGVARQQQGVWLRGSRGRDPDVYVIVMPHRLPEVRHDSFSSLRSMWRLAVRFKAVRRLQFFFPHLTLCVPTALSLPACQPSGRTTMLPTIFSSSDESFSFFYISPSREITSL